jgi:hypothetical protein
MDRMVPNAHRASVGFAGGIRLHRRRRGGRILWWGDGVDVLGAAGGARLVRHFACAGVVEGGVWRRKH